MFFGVAICLFVCVNETIPKSTEGILDEFYYMGRDWLNMEVETFRVSSS